MYDFISTLCKYVFITVIYLFILGIMRLIYLDIKYISKKSRELYINLPYLKLLNLKDSLNLNLEESYIVKEKTRIGRSKENDIELPSPFFSSKHAFIFKEDAVYYIQDLESKNGTFLNSHPVTTTAIPLANGDIIQFGQVSFIFVNTVEV